MYLKSLQVKQFKSYAEAQFDFISNINCIVGENGIGKTNLLDAIHFLSMTKSARSIADPLCIQHGEEFFMIQGNFVYQKNEASKLPASETQVTCAYQRGQKKSFLRDQKAYPRLADHIGQFPVVLMDPYDTDLIREGSEDRRRFFDGMMAQMDRGFLDNLLRYNRIVQQRNSLLKQFAERGSIDRIQLESYHEPMVHLGEKIAQARVDFLLKYLPNFQLHYAKLSDDREQVNIQMDNTFPLGDLDASLRKAEAQDLAAQRSTLGIHKDDFIFEINGFPLKKFGSQGQQKSFVVALKLAQFDTLAQEHPRKPLLLLDDIFDKLDDRRIQRLVQMMAEDHFGQVFITDARPERTKSLLKNLAGEINYISL
ncbi:DNA replication/repair protein RecF [Aquirufa rosea]|uniref:DNA replication and repair protein RecF n=1 Tax=Aquirufa rosea TaxID=2509241 RepID=A0A4Q1BXF3_9BACT|nr:DNA replication and repair protein RecF [Aquirufa rosea]RXK46847.1 DNA replication and repair protein RecF [Aquirufa rosea]